jgi:hypothetical protein
MTLHDLDPELWAINYTLSMAVTWEGYLWVFMGDVYLSWVW